MHKLLLASTLFAAVAAIIVPAPANAQTPQASPGGTFQNGMQCWRATDQGRGFGYWTNCEQLNLPARGRVGLTISRDALDSFGRADRTPGTRGTIGTVGTRGSIGAMEVGTVGVNPEIPNGGGAEGGGGGDGGGDGGGGR